MRMLYRLRCDNQRWRIYARMLVNENRWRAMRYSYDEGLIDLAKGSVIPFPDLLDELLELVAEDAEFLGCEGELEKCRQILESGTSAHKQVAAYEAAKEAGASERDALNAVVDLLIEETTKDL